MTALVAVTLAVSACGGDDTSAPATTTAPATTVPVTTAPPTTAPPTTAAPVTTVLPTTAPPTTTTVPVVTTASTSTSAPASPSCDPAVILPVLQAEFADTGVAVVSASVWECRNGFARVLAVPDNSGCRVGGNCYENEQVFLRADGDGWTVFDYGTGVTCADPDLYPELVEACVALGLREP